MSLLDREAPWKEDWVVEITTAKPEEVPGMARASGFDIIDKGWDAMAEMAQIMAAIGDPTDRDRYRMYEDAESRYVYRTLYGMADDPDPQPIWYPSEAAAREAAAAVAGALWRKRTGLRKTWAPTSR